MSIFLAKIRRRDRHLSWRERGWRVEDCGLDEVSETLT